MSITAVAVKHCTCLQFSSSPTSRYVCVCHHVSDEHVQRGMAAFACFGKCEHQEAVANPHYQKPGPWRAIEEWHACRWCESGRIWHSDEVPERFRHVYTATEPRLTIVREMALARRERNSWQRLVTPGSALGERLSAANRASAARTQLAALRRVWHVLRPVR